MYCTLDQALDDFRRGEFLVLVDAHDRENEGDLIVAAQFVTAEKINLMLREARGMFHLPTTEEHLQRRGIPLIEPRNGDNNTPRFGYPFDAREGVGTGISVQARAKSIHTFLRDDVTADDFVVPGHILPLATHPQGMAARQGHTEGSVELARLAGLFPAAAMSEVLTPDGDMARGEALGDFARHIGCRVIDVAQVAAAVT